MRCLTALFFLLVWTLGGCKDSRSFDERYDDTANRIEQRATNLDNEANGLAATASAEDQPTEP